MDINSTALTALFNQIPRRFSKENVAEINQLLNGYEDLLMKIEGMNTVYEKGISIFFEEMDAIRLAVKKSGESKNSKKTKDQLFDDASGALKDTMQLFIAFYDNEGKS